MICFPILYLALGVAEDEKVCVTIHSASCTALLCLDLERVHGGTAQILKKSKSYLLKAHILILSFT